MLQLEDSRNKTEKIQVIVDFLNNWKQGAREYVLNNVNDVLEYYDLNHQSADFWNHKQMYLNQGMTQEEWKARYKELNDKEKAAKGRIHPWTKASFSRKEPNHINEQILDELLEKEKEAKYWDLINRVTEKVGNITDVSMLHIGPKGDLEGYITGDKGKVRLETITAGGYNTDHIVNVKRGPILHYRTICVPIK